MTLLLAEGFDTRTALSSGVWLPTDTDYSSNIFTAGRLGGYALKGTVITNNAKGMRRVIPSSTTIVVGTALRWGSTGSGDWAPIILYVGATSVLTLRINGTSGGVSVNRGLLSAAGTSLGTTSVPFPLDLSTWQYVEMKIVASTGTGGSVVVRQNGVETLNLTSQNTGATSFDGFGLRLGGSGSGAGSVYGTQGAIDDVYVCNSSGSMNNDFLGDSRVYGLWPDGNGAASALVGSDGNSTDNYLLVDDAAAGAPVTTDYVGSATVGSKDTYTYTDLPSGAVVKGVQIDSYAAKSDTGAISGRNVAYDGTNTVTGSDAVLSTSYTGVSMIMENAPDGAAWTKAKVDAAQFGWEVRA